MRLVLRVETVEMEADVYCMTVVGPNGEDDRHNFAMCSFSGNSDLQSPEAEYNGVFVLNSVDEDYFIPVRGGESGTRIDTLAGGTNTTAIEERFLGLWCHKRGARRFRKTTFNPPSLKSRF